MAVCYTRLQEELVPPVVQVVKGFVGVDVVDQHRAVGPPVEGDSQTLEALLPGGVPYLQAGAQGLWCSATPSVLAEQTLQALLPCRGPWPVWCSAGSR